MYSRFFLALLLLVVCSGQTISFADWMIASGRNYATDLEQAYRNQVFLANSAVIATHNSNLLKSFTMGFNRFSDMTLAEFAATYLTATPPPPLDNITVMPPPSRRLLQVNTRVIDWVAAGKVSPVKDMLSCGSSWAFAATGTIESFSLIKNNTFIALSDQQLMDCVWGGCSYGALYFGFNYTKMGGLVNSTYYPYKGVENTNCQYYGGQNKISNIQGIYKGCSNITDALAIGPVPVFVDASNWIYYESGIVSDCGGPQANFYAVVVAINDIQWTLKNAFGTAWG